MLLRSVDISFFIVSFPSIHRKATFFKDKGDVIGLPKDKFEKSEQIVKSMKKRKYMILGIRIL